MIDELKPHFEALAELVAALRANDDCADGAASRLEVIRAGMHKVCDDLIAGDDGPPMCEHEHDAGDCARHLAECLRFEAPATIDGVLAGIRARDHSAIARWLGAA